MHIIGIVVSKTVTSNGVFSRIKVKGLPKSFMRFFDIEDVDNFQIGQKVGILVEMNPIDKAVNEAAAVLADELAANLGAGNLIPPSLTPAYALADQVSREEGTALEHLGEGDYIDLHLNVDGVYCPPSNPSADIVGAVGVEYPPVVPVVSTEALDEAKQALKEAEEESGR